MKCWHLIAALALMSCGLDTSPKAGSRSATDEGAQDAAGAGDGSELTDWPAKRRATPLDPSTRDGGTDDTSDAALDAGNADNADTQGGRDGGPGQSHAAPHDPRAQDKGSAPSGAANMRGSDAMASAANDDPTSGADSADGNDAEPSHDADSRAANDDRTSGADSADANDAEPSHDTKDAKDANDSAASNGARPDHSAGDAAQGADDDSQGPRRPDEGPESSSDGKPWRATGNGTPTADDGSHGPSTGDLSTAVWRSTADIVASIVDLVLAILDLSLGPIRPSEIENIVSAILVLALAPPELVVDSLVAVLDALEATSICRDDPERCNRLCTNLETDCRVCGRDEVCIMQVEQMCHVELPNDCH